MLFFRLQINSKSDPSELELWKFCRWNIFKSVAICNCFVFAFYVARFKTYRNSYLLHANFAATLLGVNIGTQSTAPIFWSYLFNRGHLGPGVLDDNYEPEYKATMAKKRPEEREKTNELLTACFLEDTL